MRIQTIFTFVMLLCTSLAGCGGTAQLAPVLLPGPSATTTGAPRPTLTATQVATGTPSPVPSPLPSATQTATPAAIRHTPATLMLHRSNLSFDAVQFLKDFVLILKQNQMRVVTYRDLSRDPALTATQQGRLFIISIDDIYLRYPIDPSVLEMIAVLRQAGYPAVLAVITESNYAYPQTAQTLKELSDAGWEIASHTDRHSNLGEMEKTAPRYVYTEVQTSVDKIEKAIGVRPYTLVLPEGQMVNDPRFIKRAGITWIVGITGGSTYDSTHDMVYVGREGPDGSAAETFRIMMGRFNP